MSEWSTATTTTRYSRNIKQRLKKKTHVKVKAQDRKLKQDQRNMSKYKHINEERTLIE